MTCQGFHRARVSHAGIDPERAKPAWTPCGLPRGHLGPCGPKLEKEETMTDRQARIDLLEEIRPR